jgi:hypothetical protein
MDVEGVKNVDSQCEAEDGNYGHCDPVICDRNGRAGLL